MIKKKGSKEKIKKTEKEKKKRNANKGNRRIIEVE